MSASITVRGVDRFQRTVGDAADQLRNLAVANRQVADGVRRAARPPRRTGRLAASLTVAASPTEATVSSGLVYAPVIEYGWAGHNIEPTGFLTEALDGRYAATVDVYGAVIDTAISNVKGA